MKRFFAWLSAVPHLFSKTVVVYCIAFSSHASNRALEICEQLGIDPAGVLGLILALFGGELLLLCLKTIVKPRDNPGGKDESA